MGGSSKQVTGYKYFANFLLFIGNPIEKLLGINFDKRGWLNPLVDESGNALTIGTINKPSLYGENEGGVAGQIHARYGTANPDPVSFYANYLADNDLPSLAYPYQSYLAFEDFYLGNSGYPKEMLLWPKRTRIRNDGRRQWYEVREDGAVVCEIDGVYRKYSDNKSVPFEYDFKSQVIIDEIVRNEGDESGFYPALSNDKDIVVREAEGVYTRTAFSDYGGSEAIHKANMTITTLPAGMMHRVIIDGLAVGNECSFLSNIKIVKVLEKNFLKQKQENDFFETHMYYLDCIAVIETPIQISCVSSGSVKAFEDTVGPLSDQMISLVSLSAKIFPGVAYGDFDSDGYDINPIHKIREILTDDTAMNKPESDVNDVNFMKAADRIYDEGLGISWAITEKSCIDAINELCSHIEAGVRVNRQTGLYEMVLFRDDWFEESEILTLAESKIKSISFEVQNADEAINQLNVSYYDRANIKDASFSISENAAIKNANGFVNAKNADFPYFMNQRNAAVVAQWKLKQYTSPCWKGTFTTGFYEARKWNRYDIVKINWSRKGIVNLPVRIMSINLGNGIDNTVSIKFVEVVPFSSELSSNIVVDDKIDTAPLPPLACQYEPFEMPYYLAVMALGQRKVDEELSHENGFGLVGVVAERPQNNSLYAVMMTHDGTVNEEWNRAASIHYDETADLDQIISKISSSFTVKNWKKIANVSVGTLVKCGRDWLGTPGEWMVFQGVDPYTGVVSVKRGALDTPPQEWGVDTKLYFCGNDVAYDSTDYLSGEEILVSALTTTPSGILEQGGSIPIEIQSRAIRPYPPANVKFNAGYYPESLLVTNDIVLTWVDRNRVQQTGGEILGFYDAGVTKEAGVTYNYELISENVVLSSESGITGNTATILNSVLIPNKPHILRLWSVRDGYDSYQAFEHAFFIEAASLILTATATKSHVAGNTVPTANINVVVDESLSANMKFDGSSISGKAPTGSIITIEIEE